MTVQVERSYCLILEHNSTPTKIQKSILSAFNAYRDLHNKKKMRSQKHSINALTEILQILKISAIYGDTDNNNY